MKGRIYESRLGRAGHSEAQVVAEAPVVVEAPAVSAPQSSAARSASNSQADNASRTPEQRNGSSRAKPLRARGAALVLVACLASQLVTAPVTQAATLVAMSTSVGQHAVLAATNTAILQGIQRNKAAEYGADGKLLTSGERTVRQLQVSFLPAPMHPTDPTVVRRCSLYTLATFKFQHLPSL